MDDLISRQAAIDLLKQMRKDGNMIPWEGKDVFARIRKLPSAQPYTEEEIQAMQDLEQVQLEKAYETGLREGRKRGKWKSFIDDGYVECPFCKHTTNCDCTEDARDLHFCFYCGAELRGVEE